MRKGPLFVIGFLVWTMLTWPLDLVKAAVGLVLTVGVAYFIGENKKKESANLFELKRYLNFFFNFIPVFIYYCILANLDVAYRILHPNMPIRPGIIKIKTRLKSKIGRVMLANTITLTPGTLTVDIMDNVFYIHWINVESTKIEDCSRKIAYHFENILAEVFE